MISLKALMIINLLEELHLPVIKWRWLNRRLTWIVVGRFVDEVAEWICIEARMDGRHGIQVGQKPVMTWTVQSAGARSGRLVMRMVTRRRSVEVTVERQIGQTTMMG